MHRQEYQINIRTDPNIATFIKHMYKMHVAIPRLNLGIVMVNTTTAINEEWLTAIESLPIHKILSEYIYEILTMQCNFCVYLKKTQTEKDVYISLADIDYYIIRDKEIIKIKPIEQLVETLLHSFSEFRPSNTKTIELVAFSSGTTINDALVDRLTFLDAELFNREYRNIKIVHSTQRETYLPFSLIAPEGNLRLFMERYSWFDLKDYTKKILDFLKEVITSYISKFELDKINITKDTRPSSSAYDEKKKIIFVNDVITMCVINFFGCNCQLGTFHVFDISKINMKLFSKEVDRTISEIYGSIN